ncbi:MAG: Gldg family protein [Planctomycetota bacterium]
MFVEFCFLVIIDVIFVLAVFLLMLPLIRRQAAFAVMKRNFAGYFSNPTGYVFLCIFVLLTSFAAFWPHEFFTTNLANFDQLNRFLPYIMLVFIPAITMSIWAEERRQGTDELLLTLPAKDFDIVIGKYFAAVWVFTVSLLFSQLSNYAVLLGMTGGQLDTMLLFSTYLGYWFMGIAMLSIGMVASFLTNNLTVGFIFGAAFNAPLAFFSNADVILSNRDWIGRLFEWSLLQRFEPFGRGLVALPSAFYFIGIVVIGIYLSLILIGRRHWLGGRDGTSLLWHFVLRGAFLIITVIAGVVIVQYSPLNRARMDISAEKVSTLSDSTKVLLDELAAEAGGDKPPVKVEAFISNNIPTEFVSTKYDLVNLLREFDVRAGNQLQVKLYQGLEPFSPEAILAEKRFGIRPVPVTSQSRGALREDQVVMGVAITSGREQVVIPFFPYGMPVEYELMRSINTVSSANRKTIGIIETDALAMGARLMTQEGEPFNIPRIEFINELQKQYDVESVNCATPLSLWLEDDDGLPSSRRYDVLIAIQPSKMSQGELDNLIEAMHRGQPTMILEDPFMMWEAAAIQGIDPPAENFSQNVTGTFFPRSVPRGTQGQCDIHDLWDALDIQIDEMPVGTGANAQSYSYLAWQQPSANPYKRDQSLDNEELIIVRQDEEAMIDDMRFAPDHPATRGISELHFQFSGYLSPLTNSQLDFEPLVVSGAAGRLAVNQYLGERGVRSQLDRHRGEASQNFCLAAHITGSDWSDAIPADPDVVEPNKTMSNVIYIADVDAISDSLMQVRNYPIRDGVEYRFQNMAFALNAVDSLAGVEEFNELRNRKFRHVTLRVVEDTIEDATSEVYDIRQVLEMEEFTERNLLQEKVQAELGPIGEEIQRMQTQIDRGEVVDNVEFERLKLIFQQRAAQQQQEFEQKISELENSKREELRSVQLEAELKIQEIQRWFKLMAVLIPPIPPLLVGAIVFTRRQLRERETISKARRLK